MNQLQRSGARVSDLASQTYSPDVISDPNVAARLTEVSLDSGNIVRTQPTETQPTETQPTETQQPLQPTETPPLPAPVSVWQQYRTPIIVGGVAVVAVGIGAVLLLRKPRSNPRRRRRHR